MIDFDALANPGIRGLRAYDPGHDLVALRRAHADGALVELGSMAACKEKGLVRSEGKDYVMKDGDIVLFRFNV